MHACTECHTVCANKCFYIQRSAHRSERQKECRGHDPKSLEVSRDFLFCQDLSFACSWESLCYHRLTEEVQKGWGEGEGKDFSEDDWSAASIGYQQGLTQPHTHTHCREHKLISFELKRVAFQHFIAGMYYRDVSHRDQPLQRGEQSYWLKVSLMCGCLQHQSVEVLRAEYPHCSQLML